MRIKWIPSLFITFSIISLLQMHYVNRKIILDETTSTARESSTYTNSSHDMFNSSQNQIKNNEAYSDIIQQDSNETSLINAHIKINIGESNKSYYDENSTNASSLNWLHVIKDRFEIEDKETPIRQWGCNRKETPLIFVHIGKSGGGSARPKFNPPKIFDHRPSFCDGIHSTFWGEDAGSRQGPLRCDALTPLGHAIACPELVKKTQDCRGCFLDSKDCSQVYVGHNLLGNELHWLPYNYLSNWWESNFMVETEQSGLDEDFMMLIHTHLQNLGADNKTWCNVTNESFGRPYDKAEYRERYTECTENLHNRVDVLTFQNFHDSLTKPTFQNIDWSPMYASLPVLRAVLVREPFSWLISKFFWHQKGSFIECDDISRATRAEGKIFDNKLTYGWANKYALRYLFYLCGEDCPSRYMRGISSISDLEKQAENNLRFSFAVVGLTDNMNEFYQMLTNRISYIDTSLIEEEGLSHFRSSYKKKQCERSFRSPHVQRKLMSGSRAIKSIVRLYKVAKEVNRYQMNELSQCRN